MCGWGISPKPTCIAETTQGEGVNGGEIWVSGLFDGMGEWLVSRGFDLQVARLELCCPCWRIFETSTSKNFWASPICLFRSRKGFWLKASPKSLDDFTSSRAQVNCLWNDAYNQVHAVRAVLHLNVDDYRGLEHRAKLCLTEILRSLAGGNKVGVTLSHTGATRAFCREKKGRGKVGGWWVEGAVRNVLAIGFWWGWREGGLEVWAAPAPHT
jgi:hypothetical protein